MYTNKRLHLMIIRIVYSPGEKEMRTMNIIRSKEHEIYSMKINKVALSAKDDSSRQKPDLAQYTFPALHIWNDLLNTRVFSNDFPYTYL